MPSKFNKDCEILRMSLNNCVLMHVDVYFMCFFGENTEMPRFRMLRIFKLAKKFPSMKACRRAPGLSRISVISSETKNTLLSMILFFLIFVSHLCLLILPSFLMPGLPFRRHFHLFEVYSGRIQIRLFRLFRLFPCGGRANIIIFMDARFSG